MENVAHLDKKDKQKAAETVLDPEQRREMPIVLALQKSKSVKTHLVPMI